MLRVAHERRRARTYALAGLLLIGAEDTVARTQHVRVFNQQPVHPHDIARNGVRVGTVAGSPAGVIAFKLDANAGDRIALLPIHNPDAQPPSPPVFSSLGSDGSDCALAAWLPSSEITVTGYVLSIGVRSVAAGHAVEYDRTIDVGPATTWTECGLPGGRYYAAVQAKNAFGQVSAYSPELSMTIATVAVLFSQVAARGDESGVRLSWRITADEVVVAFRVYRSETNSGTLETVGEVSGDRVTTFVDATAEPGRTYVYVVAAVRADGGEVLSAEVTVSTPPLALALGANAPNPFNPVTRIPFTLDEASRVQIGVYDVRGARVATLHDGDLGAGRHSVDWNGTNDAGASVASGVYFYTLRARTRTLSRKMIMVR